MYELIHTLFGSGKDLNTLNMICRAFVIFFITLALIRVAGMRAFGQKSPFDFIIVIMLGAILSRAITGASAFFPTVAAGAAICIIHRILALLSFYNDNIGRFVKGRRVILFRNNKPILKNMRNCCVSYKDILEEVRLLLNEEDLQKVDEVYMERSGKISIIKKKTKE